MNRSAPKQNKFVIKAILFGMLVLNLVMACVVLTPAGAQSPNPAVQVSTAAQISPQLSPVERFLQLDQAARKFWVGLLPFWDE